MSNTCGRCLRWEPNFMNEDYDVGSEHKCLELCAKMKDSTAASSFESASAS